MADEIPAVDAAEVAALADAAEPHPQAAERERQEREVTRELRETRQRNGVDQHPPDLAQAPGADWKPEPSTRGVAAQLALAAEIAAMAERLERMEAQMRHTMLLVMVLAERAHVDATEYDKATAQMRRADTAAKGQG
jgi:hypothetical protein